MANSIFVFLFTVCFALKCAESNPIEGQTSFMEGLNIQYENGTLICGVLECPSEDTGCTIRIKSDEKDRKVLYQYFNCTETVGIKNRITFNKEKSVNIEISSYVGAKPVFNIEYNDKDEEIADGIVPVDKLQELKEKFKELKRLVVEEKHAVAMFSNSRYLGEKLDHKYLLYKQRKDSYMAQVSYVEGLNFQYENGKWICGDVKCPSQTTGCRIRIKSDEKDKKALYQTFNCMNSISTGKRIELAKAKTVDIDVTSYARAELRYDIKYNDENEEFANGVVPVPKLSTLKQDFAELKSRVLDGSYRTSSCYRTPYSSHISPP